MHEWFQALQETCAKHFYLGLYSAEGHCISVERSPFHGALKGWRVVTWRHFTAGLVAWVPTWMAMFLGFPLTETALRGMFGNLVAGLEMGAFLLVHTKIILLFWWGDGRVLPPPPLLLDQICGGLGRLSPSWDGRSQKELNLRSGWGWRRLSFSWDVDSYFLTWHL